jgi:hypothetical protein
LPPNDDYRRSCRNWPADRIRVCHDLFFLRHLRISYQSLRISQIPSRIRRLGIPNRANSHVAPKNLHTSAALFAGEYCQIFFLLSPRDRD